MYVMNIQLEVIREGEMIVAVECTDSYAFYIDNNMKRECF